jgi:hypothetical protein
MQEIPRPTTGDEIRPGSSPGASGEKPFAVQNKLPTPWDKTEQPRPVPAPPSGERKVQLKWIFALGLFLVVVATVAWISQNVPNLRKPAPADTVSGPTIVFHGNRPVEDPNIPRFIWDTNPQELNYIAEFEIDTWGYYDFEFENQSDEAVIMGVDSNTRSCTCNKIQVCLFANDAQREKYLGEKKKNLQNQIYTVPADYLDWHVLMDKGGKGDPTKTLTVPGKAKGLVRMMVDGTSRKPGELRAKVEMTMRSQETKRRTSNVLLDIMMNFVEPLEVPMPEKQYFDVGTLHPKRTTAKLRFPCWSATRSDLDLTAELRTASRKPLTDARFQFDFQLLSPKERQMLQESFKLNALRGLRERHTRVRSAYWVNVQVFESKDGLDLDLGPFQKTVYLTSKKAGKELAVLIGGLVRGEVRQLGGDDPRVRLGPKGRFDSRDGTSETLTLETDEGIELKGVVGHPSYLEVDLKPHPSEKNLWQLLVKVPPNAVKGEIRAEISLQIVRQGRQPRLINIPVVGSADR